MTRVASAGTAPWVRIVSATRSAISRQRRVYTLACSHVAVVLRNGDYVTPHFYKCKECPPSTGPTVAKRPHRAHKRGPHVLVEMPRTR